MNDDRTVRVEMTVEQAKAAYWALTYAPTHPDLTAPGRTSWLPQASAARRVLQRTILEHERR